MSSSTMSSSTTSSAREPRSELPQVQVIRYLTKRILYEGEVTPRTMESFLSALWPEGLSQGLHQLLDVKSPSLIDKATSGLATCEAEREAMIYGEFVDRVQDTRCITPVTLKGLLVALSGLINVPAVRYGPVARWTLCQAHDIIHLGNQIQLEEDVKQEKMDWFVRALWPNSSSQAATTTQSLRHSVYSTLPIDSIDEHLASPAVRDRFVQLVLGAMEITDSILDWLHHALFRTAREGSPWVDGEDPFSDDEDKSDMLDEETSGDDNPSQTQSDLSCDSSTADSDKENMLPSQSPAGLEIWDSGSTTPDDKSLDYLGGSAIKKRSQFEGTAESLVQLSRDTPAAANPFMDAGYSLADNSRLHAGPAPFAQPDQGGGGYNGSSCIDNNENGTELQRMPAKRSQVEESNDGPRKRVKRSGDLIFTISAVHIRRGESGEVEALDYNSKSGAWIDLDGVEYEFNDGIFTAARVTYGVSQPSPYWWHFQSNVDNEQESVLEF
ncbi:hypothetical protein F4802DRAFT_613449 [Xylaria palmicola]|nr:hypothetical protein F4802DRAFT_613449 [Xylaria palmicola]